MLNVTRDSNIPLDLSSIQFRVLHQENMRAQCRFSQSLKNSGLSPYLSIRFLEKPHFFFFLPRGAFERSVCSSKNERDDTQSLGGSPPLCRAPWARTRRSAGCPLPSLPQICEPRGLQTGADSAPTQLQGLAKELEAPSGVDSLQRARLRQNKQLKKAGDELMPDNRSGKVAELPRAGRDPRAASDFGFGQLSEGQGYHFFSSIFLLSFL